MNSVSPRDICQLRSLVLCHNKANVPQSMSAHDAILKWISTWMLNKCNSNISAEKFQLCAKIPNHIVCVGLRNTDSTVNHVWRFPENCWLFFSACKVKQSRISGLVHPSDFKAGLFVWWPLALKELDFSRENWGNKVVCEHLTTYLDFGCAIFVVAIKNK